MTAPLRNQLLYLRQCAAVRHLLRMPASGCTPAFVSPQNKCKIQCSVSTDNNGVIIEFTGRFRSNCQHYRLNGLWYWYTNKQRVGSATKFSLDQNGFINTTFNGVNFNSFIDSGSNAYSFQDTIAQDSSGWYIPGSTLNLTATIGITPM